MRESCNSVVNISVWLSAASDTMVYTIVKCTKISKMEPTFYAV